METQLATRAISRRIPGAIVCICLVAVGLVACKEKGSVGNNAIGAPAAGEPPQHRAKESLEPLIETLRQVELRLEGFRLVSRASAEDSSFAGLTTNTYFKSEPSEVRREVVTSDGKVFAQRISEPLASFHVFLQSGESRNVRAEDVIAGLILGEAAHALGWSPDKIQMKTKEHLREVVDMASMCLVQIQNPKPGDPIIVDVANISISCGIRDSRWEMQIQPITTREKRQLARVHGN